MSRSAVARAAAALAREQDGVLTLEQAVSVGATVQQVRRWQRDEWLVRQARGVYRLRDHPLTWRTRLQSALLQAGPGSVVSRRSAARLHQLWRYRSVVDVEVTRREAGDHGITGGLLHRSSWLPPSHVTEVDGLPCTTVARTLFDLAGDPPSPLRRSPAGKDLHRKDIARDFNDALRRHGLQLAHEVAVFGALAKRGRAGTVLMRELLRDFGKDLAPTESDGESLLLELLEATGRDEPKRQVPVSDEEGFIGVLDFLYEAPMVNLEVDGITHRGPLDKRRDAHRDGRLRALGYDVVRLDYRELLHRPDRQLRRIDDALRRGSVPR